ncbi:MAG: heme ABC exporter ATP-binding protein CcmA [Pseudomonadota bacterium]
MSAGSLGVILTAEGVAGARGGRTVFEGVDLTVSAGEAVILRGANGAGKTTLLRILAGLAKPAAGTLALEGAAINGDAPTPATTAVFIGHLDAAKGAMTVDQNLQFWAKLYGGQASIADIKNWLFLADLSDRPAATLSAGQRRRLGLARALVSQRPIWLLDEPTASMDARSAARVADIIKAHCAAGGIAIVATHEPIDLPDARAFRMAAIGEAA